MNLPEKNLMIAILDHPVELYLHALLKELLLLKVMMIRVIRI
jgi:hypothetical protein